MKKYRFLSLLLLIPALLSLLVTPTAALDDIDLYCTHAVLLDANYGEILYSKKGDEKAYPASITKVMTALLVMEAIEEGRLSPDTVVTVSAESVANIPIDYIIGNFKQGEEVSIEELLYCMMLESDCDASNILGEAVDGSVDSFVEHMNRKAGELGCENTHFTNTYGLHEEDHYTTAQDIALWMQAALKYDLFRTVIQADRHTVPATNLSGERFFYNKNGLISNMYYSGYYYDKCIGGKTGTTDAAGRCLVAAAEDGETLFISVILGSGPMEVPGETELKQGQFRESKRLLQWGFDNFERVTITRGSDPVDKVKVTMSRQADEVNVKPSGSITRTLPKDMDLKQIETEITLFSKEVEAPVVEGQVLGTMKLSYRGELYGMLDLVAVTSVERSELLYKKAQFFEFLHTAGLQIALVTVMVLAALVILRLLVFRRRRRYRSSGPRRRGGSRMRR
ncbi:MAG: D-alanyl-D-alanine carboxypeptidase [Lawsonibacter sp.]|nr:D-alanyl-D-alanine carboxypeptidase [Lawsonibacter sp.]